MDTEAIAIRESGRADSLQSPAFAMQPLDGSRSEQAVLDKQICALQALSTREQGVIHYVALGCSNKFIAYELRQSQANVSICIKRVRAKLGVRSRSELIQILRLGRIAAPSAPRLLTDCERLVFEGIFLGLSNVEIAARRGRAPRTVANQVASIFHKLRVGSRAQLVAEHVSQPRLVQNP